MIKTYREAVKYLERHMPQKEKKHPGKFGFERMKYLMRLLGNPQNTYKTIHVGGTAGKGSTATIIASILATKYKVGLHTSPHLLKITERIRIDTTDIGKREFIELLNELIPSINKMEENEFGKPSYFEILTAMAFLSFAKEKVEIAVIEVGMGGRFDATNVIMPQIAVLTNVGLDHTQVLGDTVEKIAIDKAGIIKKGIEVVSGVKQESVIKILESTVKNQKSGISILGRNFSYKVKKIDETGSRFDYIGKKTYRDLEFCMLGEHQIENAAVAIRAIEKLSNYPINQLSNKPINRKNTKFQITEEDMRIGLRDAFISGRMEIVRRNPLVILDGAHNSDKIKALVLALEKIFSGKRIRCILAIKQDKDARKMMEFLMPICSELIFTKFNTKTDLGETLSYDPKELMEIAKKFSKTQKIGIAEYPLEAIKWAMEKKERNDLILITGSLYLVGEVRKFLITNF